MHSLHALGNIVHHLQRDDTLKPTCPITTFPSDHPLDEYSRDGSCEGCGGHHVEIHLVTNVGQALQAARE